eukprot:2715901-Prymnesium_polylepis.1
MSALATVRTTDAESVSYVYVLRYNILNAPRQRRRSAAIFLAFGGPNDVSDQSDRERSYEIVCDRVDRVDRAGSCTDPLKDP